MKKILLNFFIIFIFTISYAEATNYISDIKSVVNGNCVDITISATDVIEYKVGTLPATKKIYIDFNNTIIRERKTVSVGKCNLSTIRAAQNATKPKYITRVVFDLTEMVPFSHRLSEDKKQVIFTLGDSSVPVPEIVKKTIVLDAGHGGKDPGAAISDLYEKNLNLDILGRVKKLLENDGRFNVITTRTTDVFIELEDRAKVANDNKADLFVCIHNNSMPKGFAGVMTLYNDTSISENKNTAQIFQDNVAKALGKGSIGIRQRTDLVVLKKIEVPGVLVEVACMTNIIERRALRTDSFKQKAAQAIFNSIVQTVI